MTNVEKILIRMYVGLVYVLWSSGIKLGTAKLNATRQMKSFAETLDKSNPMTNTVKTTVQKMSQDVSRQIMTDKSSEMVLDKKYLQEYKKLGEKRVTESKQELMQEMARTKQAQRPQFRANQNQSFEKIKAMQKQSNDQKYAGRTVSCNKHKCARRLATGRNITQTKVVRNVLA